DRFGIKPFYFRHVRDRFLFASEIKALIQDPSYTRRPHEPAMQAYLSDSRHDDRAETFFEGISQLRPGESLIVKPIGDTVRVDRQRWWTLPDGDVSLSAADAAEQLR